MELCHSFHPSCLDGVLCAIAAIRLQNVGEFHEAGFCSSVRIDCANSPGISSWNSHPRGGSEDHSDTSEQSLRQTIAVLTLQARLHPRHQISLGDGARGGQGGGKSAADWSSSAKRNPEELPEPMREGRLGSPEAREEALVKKPQIGDTMPVPNVPPPGPANGPSEDAESSPSSNRSGQKRRRKSGGQEGQQQKKQDSESASSKVRRQVPHLRGVRRRRRRRSGPLS